MVKNYLIVKVKCSPPGLSWVWISTISQRKKPPKSLINNRIWAAIWFIYTFNIVNRLYHKFHDWLIIIKCNNGIYKYIFILFTAPRALLFLVGKVWELATYCWVIPLLAEKKIKIYVLALKLFFFLYGLLPKPWCPRVPRRPSLPQIADGIFFIKYLFTRLPKQ